MPRTKYRKPAKKRWYKRKRRSTTLENRPISSVSYNSPLKKSIKVTFRYNDLKYFAFPAGGGLLSFIFSANGLYDPDVGGIGHQPSGFDQLMTMYDHYCVIGCKMTCTFVNESQKSILCGIETRDSYTVPTDQREAIESGNCTYSTISPIGSGNNQVTVTRTVDIAKFLGVSKILSVDKCQGNTSSNPVEGIGLFPFIYCGDTSIVATRIPVNIVIEYITILHEPKAVGIS